MENISEADVKIRINRDNPWWSDKSYIAPESRYAKRVYFSSFKKISLDFKIRRAPVLLGPRRVGKTFMLKQLIQDAIDSKIDADNIMYISIDTPIYSGISLEKFIQFMPTKGDGNRCLIVFDEIQYLRDWERHLKDLVDNYPNIKFIASGSAAAALRLKSKESGAGRFSDFMLPPLTFYEFLLFLREDEKYIKPLAWNQYQTVDIEGLNGRFIDYLNYGGFPEAVLNEEIRKNPDQFIKNDIIDKILLKDLPSLYGINGIQELNKLFSFLAYNAGREASLDNIAQGSGIPKPTIKKYIEYLESAFLIIKISTVDDNCKTMQRERNFKIYLNNPSMRAALFAPVKADEPGKIGPLAESAIFSQWQHSPMFRNLKYARWRNDGEVDIVFLGADQKPAWIGEIKWSDRIENNFNEVVYGLRALLKKHPSTAIALCTTKSIQRQTILEGRPLHIMPCAAHCYMIGRTATARLDVPVTFAKETPNDQNIF